MAGDFTLKTNCFAILLGNPFKDSTSFDQSLSTGPFSTAISGACAAAYSGGSETMLSFCRIVPILLRTIPVEISPPEDCVPEFSLQSLFKLNRRDPRRFKFSRRVRRLFFLLRRIDRDHHLSRQRSLNLLFHSESRRHHCLVLQ